MKKQYTTPQLKVVGVNASAMICASVDFGNGTIDTMYGKQRNKFSGDEDCLWEEFAN